MPEVASRVTSPSLAAHKVQWILRRMWLAAYRVVWDDTRGIDESAFPSGYAVPHRRGSRMVRNLWHIPF